MWRPRAQHNSVQGSYNETLVVFGCENVHFIQNSMFTNFTIFDIYTTFAFGDDRGVGFFVSDVSALGFTLEVIVTLLKLILL